MLSKYQTCDDAASCGLLHIRKSCKSLLNGEPCDPDDCDYGHDHPAARIAAYVKRRDQAAQHTGRGSSAVVGSHPGRAEERKWQREVHRREKRIIQGEDQYP